MNVELQQMHLRNFKGVQDAVFDFSHNTVVRGTNGTGKTTLKDAFMFCLFGKDSRGWTDFGYKRRDPQQENSIIHELEYAVEVVLDIDGSEKRFERVMTEKWTKPRGQSEKVLTGNVAAYYIDRVRCATKKEYDTEVQSIASEEVLRMLTDTRYFMEQKDEVKKATLLKLAYGTTDIDEAEKIVIQEVLQKHPQFGDFLRHLNNTPIKEFNATTAAKIKAINGEIEEIPIKISSKQEAMPEEEDWDGLQAVIEANQAEAENIDRQIADVNARTAGATEALNKLRSELSNKEFELLKAENEVRRQINNRELEQRQAYDEANAEVSKHEREMQRIYPQLADDRKKLATLQAKLEEKREQWKQIVGGTFQYTDTELRCPTCHREYDREQLVEHKKQENKSQGMALRADYDRYSNEIALLEKQYQEAGERKEQAVQRRQSLSFKPADQLAAIAADPTCQALRKEKAELQARIAEAPVTNDTQSLQEQKREIMEKINNLNRQLGARETIATINKQIAELQEKQRALNTELGKLEMLQDTALQFQKAKDEMLIEKVNRLFQIVSWDFISEQYNGGEKIACNCYVDGMPYYEKNQAGQVNAGLDIINAIGRSEGIHLPIFIDNAESVVEYLHTDSQLILLTVDKECKKLKFEHE